MQSIKYLLYQYCIQKSVGALMIKRRLEKYCVIGKTKGRQQLLIKIT